ncbi:uncharacterized protein CYBJADRAFT_167410 [Cyberlindnera jadinii NRRL Y-1542]|uniref:Uncharacterized protein n=1 Tax=Cyberlindnera jadinii (strain ATCC 18201 / CBS 1600 / BCRC 20928 / JCM 3617 / NBRC 0987 / NRRL Y-1542) TaxID=983966 RepID=A0A1E4S3C3_CYBJN|nr:hypothetical protein CYBJADRAFT_167410 [Cyberlindnera jadinii NRRL Y-1542]ODV74027.1 hypothetical protein CYBJADRAFT_167410 [Cyberlindnera jadinii NRRL Y-1542]
MGDSEWETGTGGLGVGDSEWETCTGGLALVDSEWGTRSGGLALGDSDSDFAMFVLKPLQHQNNHPPML